MNALDPNIVYAGFTCGSSFISKSIRVVTREKVNHTFILYESRDWRRWLEHGAINSGFNAVAAGTGGMVKDMVACLRPPPGLDLRVGMEKHPEFLNMGYDWLGLLGMLPVELADRLGKNIRNPFARKSSNFCSEALDVLVRDSGGKLEYDRGPERSNTLNPGEMLRALLKAGWVDEMAEGGRLHVAKIAA